MRAPIVAIVLLPFWVLATGATFERSALSGLSGEPKIVADARAALDQAGPMSPACKATLSQWTEAKLRAQIAEDLPTSIIFQSSAERVLDAYAAGACPAGAFLVAVGIAQSAGRAARQRTVGAQ